MMKQLVKVVNKRREVGLMTSLKYKWSEIQE